MDPFTIALIVSAIASVVGGVANFFSQKEANEANKDIARETNEFSAQEAERNRIWQEQMSNTAHQREVVDLKKAGLNPWLGVSSTGSTVSSTPIAQGQAANINSTRAGEGLFALSSSLQSLAFMQALQKGGSTTNQKELFNRLQSQNRHIAYYNRHFRR